MRRSVVLMTLAVASVFALAQPAGAVTAQTCGVPAGISAWQSFSACPPPVISGTFSAPSSRDGSSWSGRATFSLRSKDPITGFADSEPVYDLTAVDVDWTVNQAGTCSASGSGKLGMSELSGQLVLHSSALPSGYAAPPAARPFHYTGSISLRSGATLPRYTVTCSPPLDYLGTHTEAVSSRDSMGTSILYISLVRDRPVENVLTDLNTFSGTLTQGDTYVATWTWAFTGGFTPAKAISQRGVDFIEREEGYRGKAYNDELGYCTIGYGTLLVPKHQCNAKDRKLKLTKAQAEQRLRDDLDEKFEPYVRKLKVQLTQCQYDALASFVYNVSTKSWTQLTKGVTQATLPSIAKRLLAYNKGKDTKTGKYRVVKAVDGRRKREAAMFDRCPCDDKLPALKSPYYK